jgi:uncharacterized protein (TIGR00369 family)
LFNKFDYGKITPAMLQTFLRNGIAHCRELNIGVADLGPGFAILTLPYDQRLIGDPETGVLHGGAVTTLIDTVCGMAVLAKIGKPVTMATLDLRIDYLKPATANKEIHARGECYKLTKLIAFVRADAYHPDNPAEWIASCAATFMIGSSEGPPHSPKFTKADA